RLARDGRLGEHARGLLERRGRDEAVGRQRGLRDAEQHGLRRGGALALRDDPLVLLLEPELVHELAHDELRVADLFDPDASEHLADDDLDVLVVDRDALEAVDLLHLVHEVALQLAVAEHRQVVVVSRGILAMMSAATTSVPSATARFAPTGSGYRCRSLSASADRMMMPGWSLPSGSSMTTLRARPVTSSNSSRTVTPSMISW